MTCMPLALNIEDSNWRTLSPCLTSLQSPWHPIYPSQQTRQDPVPKTQKTRYELCLYLRSPAITHCTPIVLSPVSIMLHTELHMIHPNKHTSLAQLVLLVTYAAICSPILTMSAISLFTASFTMWPDSCYLIWTRNVYGVFRSLLRGGKLCTALVLYRHACVVAKLIQWSRE